MKTLLSLFDYSGAWGEPFMDHGWNVIPWDIKIDDLMDINLLEDAETVLDMFEDVDGILAAAPCTDFASSGARWFKGKDQSGQTEKSVELVNQVLRIVDLFRPTDPDYEDTFFWAIENPVGRIGRLCGLTDPLYFQPWQFAGYVPQDPDKLAAIRSKKGIGVTREEADFIIASNAYTKKTGLWGEFNRNLIHKPVQAVMGNQYGTPLMRFGGNSAKTKELRSNTPAGFATAFAAANHNFSCNQIQTSQQIQIW
jgi:hypothetical protein